MTIRGKSGIIHIHTKIHPQKRTKKQKKWGTKNKEKKKWGEERKKRKRGGKKREEKEGEREKRNQKEGEDGFGVGGAWMLRRVGAQEQKTSYQQRQIDINIFSLSSPAKGQTTQITPLTM